MMVGEEFNRKVPTYLSLVIKKVHGSIMLWLKTVLEFHINILNNWMSLVSGELCRAQLWTYNSLLILMELFPKIAKLGVATNKQ